MNRHGNAVRRPSPSHFVDRTSRQYEGSARIGVKLERPAACHDLVFDRPAQYYVEEVLDVLVLCDDARRDGVVLDREPRPAHLSTRQRWTNVQEWLDAPFAYHLDSGKNDGAARRSVRSRCAWWSSDVCSRHASPITLWTAN